MKIQILPACCPYETIHFVILSAYISETKSAFCTLPH